MKHSKDRIVHKTTLVDCWFGDDGILYTVSKPGERSKENYLELFRLYAQLSDNGQKKFCQLADITETHPTSKEVRDLIATETGKYVRALALISSSSVGTATASIFEMLGQTPYMVATFQSREVAIRWLQQVMATGPSAMDNLR